MDQMPHNADQRREADGGEAFGDIRIPDIAGEQLAGGGDDVGDWRASSSSLAHT